MITKSIPNLFTIANLSLGIISIILVFNNNIDWAAIMVIFAMLTDGLDGRVARALNVQSEFGKELDSLSDVISFGVAPAFIMYVVGFQDISPAAGWIVTAIFPICGALRLARYNVVAGTPGYFIGLPIPAAGGVLCTLALFFSEMGPFAIPILLVSSLILSFLMISRVKYPNFKKVGFPKKAVWITPLIILLAVIAAIIFPGILSKLIFVPLVIYALLGIKRNVRGVIRGRGRGRKAIAADEDEIIAKSKS